MILPPLVQLLKGPDMALLQSCVLLWQTTLTLPGSRSVDDERGSGIFKHMGQDFPGPEVPPQVGVATSRSICVPTQVYHDPGTTGQTKDPRIPVDRPRHERDVNVPLVLVEPSLHSFDVRNKGFQHLVPIDCYDPSSSAVDQGVGQRQVSSSQVMDGLILDEGSEDFLIAICENSPHTLGHTP